MDPTLADIIHKRIELRDEIARIKKVQADELRPAYQAAEQLDALMLEYFSREGCKSLVTGSGTAYRKTSYNVKMMDREEYRSWIIDENFWDAADIKPNKTAAVEFLNQHKRAPPGTDIDARFTVGYRRKGEEEEGEEI